VPISWWIQDLVDEGREKFNFSTWTGGEDGDDVYESVVEGEMPSWSYHPWDRLSDTKMDKLPRGLKVTFPGSGETNGNEGDEREQDDD
jgi:hypothetical protein